MPNPTSDLLAEGREEVTDPRFERRIEKLQKRFGVPSLRPPPIARDWSKAILTAWYKDGGMLKLSSAAAMEDHEKPEMMQYIGLGLPVRVLQPLDTPPGGLLGAAARSDTAVFDRLAEQIGMHGFALAELGAPASLWAILCSEGRRLWPRMSPGIVSGRHGVTTHGRDPSGNRRGDKYITSGNARTVGAFPALAALDEALACIGTALNDSKHLRQCLVLRSDPFFARFPGDGSKYGAHFDGGGAEGCRLTTIAYCNDDWRPESDGGELYLLDEQTRCWQAVRPVGDHIVIFRADAILHKVEPTYRERFALTAWWYASTSGRRGEPHTMRQVDASFDHGDPCRLSLFQRAADGSSESALLQRMRTL